ncbi:MAG: ABC transporter substrate-binding protein [Rhodospirillaceae bacterium]|jgi:peptide/nickel transport system substrate-binding protein|nr:ABC transporter substrate-binding protein [Rhodospirillaceae bacterium]MBT5240321.1 ABC transporter substrate-binding protein [Rhodospirillaceae bacterium]MBT5566079.1 ABC transporter substrate-binding protein [Rhodospirillaceae bacterium]MBT6090007.1 ABC transporter substrate-binding protein [Rhodospirillaceae bacterium]MBT6961351.1 ABC transporter substrate-binding protein [Rhodospirillaceae bacterium]
MSDRLTRCHVAAWLLMAGIFLPFVSPQAETTLRVGITSFSTSRGNPFGTTSGLPPLYTYAAFFEGLTRVNNNAEPIPMLAERWEPESETAWLFYLRPGAVFSNGEPVDAEAVAATYAIMQTDIGKTYPVTRELAGIVAVEVVDDTTVRIKTSAPDALLPHKVAALKIVPPRYWADVGVDEFAAAPIGSGPFMITDSSPARMKLVRSPTAWRQPIVDNLEFTAAAEPVARVQGVLSGQLHIGVQLGPDEIPLVEAAGHKMLISVDPSMQVLAFITVKESPLQDIRVRRALNYAVNRDGIAQGLLGGYAKMATQTTPSFAFGWNPDIEPWPYDPERAKAMLAEAGYPDGFSFSAEILLGSASYSPQVYQQVAADLARIGVTLSLRQIPASQYARGVYQGKWAGEAIGIDYGVNPSLDALTPMVRHSCLWITPWFCDPSVPPMIAKAEAAFDLEERRILTQEVMAHQLSLAPAILLYETTRFDAVSSSVQGYEIAVGHISYDKISIDD